MRHPRPVRSRAGFTLLEMIISMMLLLILMGISTALFRRQTSALASQAGRLEAQASANFGIARLDRDLRVAGVGTVASQPLLVQADSMAITFNVDLVSRDSADLSAVYIDPDADSASTLVFNNSAKTKLPRSTFYYPDSTYMQSVGVPSAAETISYWLSLDSTKSSNREYILFRRANAGPAFVVSTGIIVNPGDTVFQYFKADTLGNLTAVPMSSLPLYHSADVHGSVSDTGVAAMIDSIHTVHVTFQTVYHDKTGDALRKLQATIHLMNAGLDQRTTCGQPPIGVTPSAVATAANLLAVPSVPAPFVTLSWSPSVDDGGGEKDVDRYIVYRRLTSDSGFTEPIGSVPAGSSTYTFVDSNVLSGQQWIYGVSAEDCTPASSPIGTTGTITIP